jgi:hypothetical protein
MTTTHDPHTIAAALLMGADGPCEDRDAIGSPSSWVVLATAHMLATDTLNWHRLDRTNRLRVANAIHGTLTEPA